MRKKQVFELTLIGVFLGIINLLFLSKKGFGFSIRDPNILIKIVVIAIPVLSILLFLTYGYMGIYRPMAYEHKIQKMDKEDILRLMRETKRNLPFMKKVFSVLEEQLEVIDKKRKALLVLQEQTGKDDPIVMQGFLSVENYAYDNIKRILLNCVILTEKDYKSEEKAKFNKIIKDNENAIEMLQELLEKVVTLSDKEDTSHLMDLEATITALDNFMRMNGR